MSHSKTAERKGWQKEDLSLVLVVPKAKPSWPSCTWLHDPNMPLLVCQLLGMFLPVAVKARRPCNTQRAHEGSMKHSLCTCEGARGEGALPQGQHDPSGHVNSHNEELQKKKVCPKETPEKILPLVLCICQGRVHGSR